jgi:hypothetical protein
MLRRFVGSMAVLFLCVGLAAATDKTDTKTAKDTKDAKDKKGQKATITKVDRKNGTITLRMPGKDGKPETRTFKLTEEVRMLDSTGRAIAIDVFQSGDEVLVFEAEGKLKEIHKHKGKGTKDKSGTDKKPGGSS